MRARSPVRSLERARRSQFQSATRENTMSGDNRVILAYEVSNTTNMPITCGAPQRAWMDASDNRFAYRCLPMVLANQACLMIENPADFTACWNGGTRPEDSWIEFGGQQSPNPFTFHVSVGPNEGARDSRVSSHFGSGVITFQMPYLFRTPPGINLWVKGPANLPKDGACALEGIVEADWSAATFTMNWQLTRPGLIVEFKRGEPICMIVPVVRGLAEGLEPQQAPIGANPELEAEYRTWRERRTEFLRVLPTQAASSKTGWEKDYFQGRSPSGDYFEGHQTQIRIKEFVPKPL